MNLFGLNFYEFRMDFFFGNNTNDTVMMLNNLFFRHISSILLSAFRFLTIFIRNRQNTQRQQQQNMKSEIDEIMIYYCHSVIVECTYAACEIRLSQNFNRIFYFRLVWHVVVVFHGCARQNRTSKSLFEIESPRIRYVLMPISCFSMQMY